MAIELASSVYNNTLDSEEIIRWGDGRIQIFAFSFLDSSGDEINVAEWSETICIKLLAKVKEDVNCENVGFGFSFRDRNGLDIIVSTTIEEGAELGPFNLGDEIALEFELENILAPGEYLLTFQSEDRTYYMPKYFDFVENAKVFKVIANKRFFSLTQPKIIQKIEVRNH